VCAPQKKKKINEKRKNGNARGASLYLLGPSGSSFRPLKLPESTLLAKGFFDFLVNSQFAMVIMSCQLLFIDFFGPFCHFLDPFVIFSSLKII
jgi:DNA replication protein DnaC